MTGKRRIVVLGGMAEMPYAGVAWQVLHYLEGFRRLGHDVVYVEDTQTWPYDPDQETFTDDAGPAARRLGEILGRFGFGDSWAYRDVARDGAVLGADPARFRSWIAGADVLVNLSGMTVLRDEHMDIPVRVYLETDPVTPQLAVARDDPDMLAYLDAHTAHFSFGERLGAPDCGVPVGRFDYRPTRQPVVLDWWAPPDGTQAPPADPPRFTTIANWEQTHRDVEWEGETYTWTKSVEFLKVLDVPRRAGITFDAALALDDEATIARLEEAGWQVAEARPLSRDLEAYRAFVRGSDAEFTVAKDQNVRLRSGWFSDRTATYLAAGRPAVVQDTGFDVTLPTGAGLMPFLTPDEAVAAIEEVVADYPRHSRAAREIAEAHFDAGPVLARLLEEAGA